MTQGARIPHAVCRMALFLAAAVATPVPITAQVAMNLTGQWGSNTNLTYTITQANNQFVWRDSAGTQGSISTTPTGLHTVWSDAGGTHSAAGTITAKDGAGQPTRIEWSNGVIFERRQATMMVMTDMIPVSPAAVGAATSGPPPGQVPIGVTGACQLLPEPGPMLAGMPVPAGGLLLTLKIPEITASQPGGGVGLRGVTFASVAHDGGRVTGGAASAERADVSPFTIRKFVDTTSPGFLQHHLAGKVLTQAVIAVYDSNGKPQAAWTLDAVVITAHTLSFDGAPAAPGGPYTEEIKLSFSRLTLLVYRYSEQGQVTCAQTRYDLAANKPF